ISTSSDLVSDTLVPPAPLAAVRPHFSNSVMERIPLLEGRQRSPERVGLGGQPARATTDAADYCRGENDAGMSSLFSWRTGRTPDCGGHWPPLRDSSRMRFRSLESL